MDINNLISRTKRKKHYILKIVDNFTKHVDSYAQPKQEAKTIALMFLNEFLARFCVP